MLGSFIKGAHTKTDILLFRTIHYVGFFAFLLNPIPTRLCHMIYYHGDKKCSYLVGIGLLVRHNFNLLLMFQPFTIQLSGQYLGIC